MESKIKVNLVVGSDNKMLMHVDADGKIQELKTAPYLDKVLNNAVVSMLIKDLAMFPTAELVGGAITDIIDGRAPKDYDLVTGEDEIRILNKLAGNKDFEFLYNSPSSITFLYKKMHDVQFIKSSPEDFYFLNERNSFKLSTKKFTCLFASLIETKLLAVNPHAMDKHRFTASQFGIRVRHWERKGYKISDISYDSCIRKADRKPNISNNS